VTSSATGAETVHTAGRSFAIRRELAGQTAVVAVSGELDLDTAPTLKRHLVETLQDRGGPVVVDLSHVSFIDSTAIGVLIGAARALPPRQLMLVGRQPAVTSVFATCGLEHRFPHHATLDEALAEIGAGGPA